ncbi:hypothetical protein NP233_g7574 [Leucocoprinus birnbaumii]|uniref:DNA 3'-5' helicase n=1 Tax=Leucocoprinus birnbaumii TaxID=56174 RepID=A0AAD5VUF5_9AGAR|nr:hypothetical protein NP233_g7574 [Leucocoprinus birnbaumii]
MPKRVLTDVKNKLQMQNTINTIIQCSNERKNIQLIVEEMKYPANSFLDLRRILNLGAGKPKKFMVFVNKRREAELIVEELWKDLEKSSREKVAWFHSGMSTEFQEDYIRILRDGEVYGLVCTDAAGMGLDLPDIELVIQWQKVKSLSTLMQRFGRAAHTEGSIMPSKRSEPLPPSFIIRPAYQTLDGIVPPPAQRMSQPVLALAPFAEPPSEIDLVEGYSENCWDIDPAPVQKYHDIKRMDVFQIPFKENEDEDDEEWDMELLMKNLRGMTSQLLLGDGESGIGPGERPLGVSKPKEVRELEAKRTLSAREQKEEYVRMWISCDVDLYFKELEDVAARVRELLARFEDVEINRVRERVDRGDVDEILEYGVRLIKWKKGSL